MNEFDFDAEHAGGLAPVPYDDAVRRVSAYLGDPGSGWVTFDLPAIHARNEGQFDSVGPWSLLLANALSGRVAQADIAAFTPTRRMDFASLVLAVPNDTNLADLDDDALTATISLASFGFSGVWAAKTTKLAALYRPRAIPVLDRQMARAFGMENGAFRVGSQRKGYIEEVITRLASWHRNPNNSELLSALRSDIAKQATADVNFLSDVRLTDILIWTTQDDRSSKRSAKQQDWVDVAPNTPMGLDEAKSIPIIRIE